MSEALVKKELSLMAKDIWEDVLYVIQTNSISSPREIAAQLNVKEEHVIELLNNDDFYNAVCANSLSSLRLSLHSKAYPKLIEKLEDDKEFFNAYDRLTKAIVGVAQRDNESMKVSLELLVKDRQEEKNITPHKQEADLNTVSKVSGNIFGIEDNNTEHKRSEVSPHTKQEIELDYEWEE